MRINLASLGAVLMVTYYRCIFFNENGSCIYTCGTKTPTELLASGFAKGRGKDVHQGKYLLGKGGVICVEIELPHCVNLFVLRVVAGEGLAYFGEKMGGRLEFVRHCITSRSSRGIKSEANELDVPDGESHAFMFQWR